MSPKARFQVMLEPEQLAALRRVELQTDVPVARQIRRAIDFWLKQPAATQEVARAFDETGFTSGTPAKPRSKKTAPRRSLKRRKA